MKLITDASEYEGQGTSIVIGKFDGIHSGHKKLLNAALRNKKNGLDTAVLTFDMPIQSFFTGKNEPVLTTLSEKREIFEALGFDYVLEMPVNQRTVSKEPEDFIRDTLVRGLRAKFVASGPDMSFGYKGRGNFELLSRFSGEYGYQAEKISKVLCTDPESGEQKEISSTLIKKVLSEGRMEFAAELLGRPYSIEGIVTHGRGIGGDKLRMPTVNITPDDTKILPPNGVYFSRISILDGDAGIRSFGSVLPGITNIGCKPTVSDEKKIVAESNIFDFDSDLYGKRLRIDLIHFERPEIHFPGLDELRIQMHEDGMRGRSFFELN